MKQKVPHFFFFTANESYKLFHKALCLSKPESRGAVSWGGVSCSVVIKAVIDCSTLLVKNRLSITSAIEKTSFLKKKCFLICPFFAIHTCVGIFLQSKSNNCLLNKKIFLFFSNLTYIIFGRFKKKVNFFTCWRIHVRQTIDGRSTVNSEDNLKIATQSCASTETF